jgi:aryl-alcohol dehydrogenase-like predicted oxidoreductase
MEYRTLTGTGTTVSRLCLGTFIFGTQVDEQTSTRLVHQAVDAGINFIDTADIYGEGVSETIVGRALEGRRDGLVLAGKVRWRVGPHRFKDAGLSRWHIIHGVEASLKRLKTDCLDILFFHSPDYSTPLEESLAAADLLVRQGKAMHIGMSNYAAWQVCHARWICDKRNYASPAVTQVVYNMITRGIEQEFVPFCREMEMGITVYNPLAGGLLTGKHDPDRGPAAGTRFDLRKDYYARYWTDANFSAIAELDAIARASGRSLLDLALQWLLAQQAIDSVILGVSKVEHLEQNIAAAEGKLDDATLAACDKVWETLKGSSFQYNR